MDQDTRDVHDAIARDRDELADTVEALAHKADVKGRVKETVSRNAEQIQQKAGEVRDTLRDVTPEQAQSRAAAVAHRVQERPLPLVVAGVFLLGLLIGRRLGRRR